MEKKTYSIFGAGAAGLYTAWRLLNGTDNNPKDPKFKKKQLVKGDILELYDWGKYNFSKANSKVREPGARICTWFYNDNKKNNVAFNLDDQNYDVSYNYENEYNGGMGSNGLTSARHDVFHRDYALKYPESFDSAVVSDLVYSGSYKVTDTIPGVDVNIGKLVLSPTRTYTPVVIDVLKELRSQIHGFVHCSGGAQTKVLHFIENLHVRKVGFS